MKLDNQKRIAGEILKCSPKKIKFDTERLTDIEEAITKKDIKGLINEGVISIKQKNYSSRVRARKRASQKRKNSQKGPGRRKGSRTARLSKKEAWIKKIRAQRKYLKLLREKDLIVKNVYQKLYLKAKGGFFRNKRHIKLYVEEYGLLKNEKKA